MMLTKTCRLAGLSALLVLGCDGETERNQGSPTPGDAGCEEWRSELCDWAGRCGAGAADVAECRRDAAGIACASDQVARTCAQRLSAGTCQATTAQGCDLSDLADRTVARAACEKFGNAFCTSFERCGEGSKASCLAMGELTKLCDEAIGSAATLEGCVQELGTVPCSAEEPPTSCQGAILTSR